MALAQNSSKFLQRKSLHAHRISPFSPKAGMAATDGEGAKVKTDLSDDRVSATFIIREEDHTLGFKVFKLAMLARDAFICFVSTRNSLRYVLAKNEKTSFVGYSVPHPSEPVMNLRLQAQEGDKQIHTPQLITPTSFPRS